MMRIRTSDAGGWRGIVEIHYSDKNSTISLFLSTGKSTSHVSQWWNIVEIYHAQTNSKMISFRRREKLDRRLLSDKTFLKFIIFREILK